jgi:hypothetical protein
VEELVTEIRELHDRIQDVDDVSKGMKQLEEVVQELEEGLEDARRGEAEARGEVEFLRGEVERTKAELERERQKFTETSSPKPVDTRGIEQRDDEIRGLKAIIHSLSSGPDLGEGSKEGAHTTSFPAAESSIQESVDRLEREKKELQILLERKSGREEELEKELGKFQRSSVISNAFSDKTMTQEKRLSGRDSRGTVMSWRDSSASKAESRPLASMAEVESVSSTAGSATLWCEICETGGHDILTCPNIDGSKSNTNGAPSVPPKSSANVESHFKKASISSLDPDKPKPLTMGKKALPPPPGLAPSGPLPLPLPSIPSSTSVTTITSAALDSIIAGKDGTKNANKWCAICEHDGHDSINCPMEDQF